MAATIPVWLGNAYISGCMQDSNAILTAIFAILRSSSTVQQVWKRNSNDYTHDFCGQTVMQILSEAMQSMKPKIAAIGHASEFCSRLIL